MEEEFGDIFARMNAEMDQFRAAISELAQAVIAFRRELRASRAFTREEQFLLTQEFQMQMFGAFFANTVANEKADQEEED